jgi:hypothetical protein
MVLVNDKKIVLPPPRGISTPQDCPPPPNKILSRPLSFGPTVKFIHILKIATDGAKLNIAVNIAPVDCEEWGIMLVARDNVHLVDSLFMSFNPVSPGSAAGNSIIPVGFEEWFPFQPVQAAAQQTVGIGYRFKGTIPPVLYFHIGQEAGGANYQNTFAYGPDLFFGFNTFGR